MNFDDLKADVMDRGLCARCGLCAGVCPVSVIGFDDGLYPKLTGKCIDCGLCRKVCPGIEVDYPALSRKLFNEDYDPESTWGHQDALYVGHPTDDSIRKNGASGGLTTALLVYLLNTGRIKGAAVVGMDPEQPFKAKSILARTEEELRAAAKSKYCIVPSMDVLAEMRKEEGPFAVVTLPCQIHGLRKLADEDPKLAGKISHILGLYCHYNMEPDGYLDALRAFGIDPTDVGTFEFRGGGWPGGFRAIDSEGKETALHAINIKNVMTVMLRLYGAERCYLCTDALCEFADLGLGDFWAIDYPDEFGDLSWCTLVSQRTEAGRELLESAERDGAIVLHKVPPERYSKRTENFTMEKKREGFVRLRRRARQGKPIPDFHYEVPRTTVRSWMVEALYRSTRILRPPRVRRAVLKILFSKAGEVIDKVNTWRKDVTLRFHNN